MSKSGKGTKGLLAGKAFKDVDPAKLRSFEKAMKEDVIPQIAKIVETRRLKAAENRARQLKC